MKKVKLKNNVFRDYFGDNYRDDIAVNNNGFSFSLHRSISSGQLRIMGKKLRLVLEPLARR